MSHSLPLSVEWNQDHFLVGDEPFVPKIFDASVGEQPPEGFNLVSIKLDARLSSSLQWKEEKAYAQQLVDRGLFVFWQLDLGFFRDLTQPLADEMQFRSLGIAVEHFVDALWSSFQSQSFGVSFYRGALDFSHFFPWDDEQRENLQFWLADRGLESRTEDELQKDEEGRFLIQQFCCDAVVEYLELLSTRLPPNLAAFALLEAYSVHSPVIEAALLSRERFQHIHPILRGGDQSHRLLRWEGGSFDSGFIGRWNAKYEKLPEASIGLCLPAAEKVSVALLRQLEQAVEGRDPLSYRFISEECLTEEWGGLDQLLYVEDGVSVLGRRKLDGFVAAGGELAPIQ